MIESERVRLLFDSMFEDSYAGRGFPELTWDDIPALLARSESTRELTRFPRSPISSQFESTCREGMVALWLVEGVRQGGRFGSLNALCFDGPAEDANWRGASEANHERILFAYRKWWKTVSERGDSGAAIDPLEGTGLRWH